MIDHNFFDQRSFGWFLPKLNISTTSVEHVTTLSQILEGPILVIPTKLLTMFICWLKLADISRCIRTTIKICQIKNAVWKNQKSYSIESIEKQYKHILYSRINADTFLVYNLDHKFQNYDVSIYIYGAVKGIS